MPYGTIKIDTITFTDAGVDKSIAVSGLVQNPTFTGNVTVTGTVSGTTVRATTVSGVTVSGTTANFASGVFTTQISGAIHVAPAGTAGAPSVQVGTGASIAPGLYSPATDQLGISTGGSFRLVIDSNGRVGIGTANPGCKLEVFGASNANEIRSSDGTIISQWYQDTNGLSIFGTVSNHPQVFRTNSTERMRIDSSGRVGIGTSSPTGGLQLANPTAGSAADFVISNPANNWSIKTGTTTNALSFVDNQFSAERLRIDSSGRLLVGTTAARTNVRFNVTNYTPDQQLEGAGQPFFSVTGGFAGASGPYLVLCHQRSGTVGGNTVLSSGDDIGVISFNGADGTNVIPGAQISAIVDAAPGISNMPGRLVFSTTADGASSPTERMRISAAGNVLCNTTSAGSAGGVTGQHTFSHSTSSQWSTIVQHTVAAGNVSFGLAIKYTAATPNNTSSEFLYCEDATALRASIRSNGGLANFSANNANLSDRNAKKDISPAADTWDCIKEWEIVNYRYKDQPDDADLNLGVIAQQVAESCPEVITVFQEAKEATEDYPAQEERLGVKEQQMYWMAIKALQEAQARIEALEADVAQLKGA